MLEYMKITRELAAGGVGAVLWLGGTEFPLSCNDVSQEKSTRYRAMEPSSGSNVISSRGGLVLA